MQRRGYATEAAGACLDEARRRFPGDELAAIIQLENIASLRIAERIGISRTEDDHGHPGSSAR